jgi:predicted nucleic acid-binding protein
VIVADANLVASLVVPGEASEIAEALQQLHVEWVAPPLIHSELRSVFSKLVRNRVCTPRQAGELLEVALDALGDTTSEPSNARVLELVASSQCSSYDCEYVALADALGCVLATCDVQVLRAFPDLAVHPERLLASG